MNLKHGEMKKQKHSLFSQNQDIHVKWFDGFNKEAIKAAIIEHLQQFPDDVIEHTKEYDSLKKNYGMEIINFYKVHSGKPSLIVLKGNKEYYKPLT